MKNLIIRALTGIAFVAIIVGAICAHPITFLIAFTLVTGLLLWEFYGLVNQNEKASLKRIINSLGGAYLFAATFFFSNGWIDGDVFLPYLLFLIYTFVGELYYKASNPINNWALTLFGQVYCAGSFSLLNFIAASSATQIGSLYFPLFVLAIFVFIWLNDTGAYLVGVTFGKHRLFERISPKKSWEGFWGGLVVALASSLLFVWLLPEISWYKWMGLATTVVLFGTWGDLVESLLKRTLNVKDSGNILPGHGGMLDRFDSILLAIPAAYIYIELVIQN